MKRFFGIVCLSIFVLSTTCFAEYFVAHKDCNVRSGPGTHFEILTKMKKWNMRAIPDSFKDYNAQWILVGKVPKEETFIVKGWCRAEIEKEKGDHLYFRLFKDGEMGSKHGELVELFEETREIDDNIYQYASFKVTKEKYVDGMWVHRSFGKILSDDIAHRSARERRIREQKIARKRWIREQKMAWERKFRGMEIPEDIKELIIKEKIRIGMTDEQVILSWGPPDRKNVSVGSYGKHEQWIYSLGNYYLYFKNGTLTSYQFDER